MASEKLVFRNAEERGLWRDVVAHSGLDESGRCDEADAAVLAYRERCGPELESLFMGTPLSKLNPDEKNKLRKILDLPPQPTRDEGPWAVWIPRLKQWRGYECDGWYVVASAVAFFNRLDAEAERERFDRDTAEGESIVAPFPSTRAEFERGPGAVDGTAIGGGA